MGPALSSEYKVTSDKHGEEGRRAQKGGGRLPAGLSCIPLDSVRGVFWILLVRQRERIPRFFFVCVWRTRNTIYTVREREGGGKGEKSVLFLGLSRKASKEAFKEIQEFGLCHPLQMI